jgi:signal transduction histidine kinase
MLLDGYRMRDLAKRFFEPLNVAAYLAWAAIGFDLFGGGARSTGIVGAAWYRPSLLALYLGFMLVFLWCTRYDDHAERSPQARAWVLLQAALALAIIALARSNSTPVLLIVVAAQAVRAFSAPGAIVVGVAINAALWWIFSTLWGFPAVWVPWILFASFQAFAAMTSLYAFRAERASAELAQVNADLLATRSLLAESARDQERLRLARELHDVAGHKLTALKLNLAALAREPTLAGRREVALGAQLADELLGDIRGVVRALRQHEGMDLRAAIAQLAAPFPRPRVHLEVTDDARVESVAQAEVLLRAAQEALTNAARHAGADNVWIVLRRDGDRVTLAVRDDGRGGGELRFGHGLTGMRERLEGLGGALAVERTPTGGVALTASLPAEVTP